jgi:predicted secreted protein
MSVMVNAVDTRSGSTFQVELLALPSAGYRWELVLGADSAALVGLLASEWQRPPGEMLGGPAKQVFRFKALVPGELDLVFCYRRPWQTGDELRHVVRVRIGPASTTDKREPHKSPAHSPEQASPASRGAGS